MSESTIRKISGMKELLLLILAAGSLVIGLGAFLIMPKRLDAMESKQLQQDIKLEKAREDIGELKGDVKSLLRSADRIERKIQ